MPRAGFDPVTCLSVVQSFTTTLLLLLGYSIRFPLKTLSDGFLLCGPSHGLVPADPIRTWSPVHRWFVSSQQLVPVAFWRVWSWSFCWHSSAPIWSLVEACTHVLMDMTCRLTGLDSVSPVLDLSHGHGLCFYSVSASILQVFYNCIYMEICRLLDSAILPSIRLDIVMSC